ncbi:ribosomal protein S18-alanine N-acetyltransferase [Cupriavidus sp. AU9028]|uniref:ribosomal protein S18-alanine N-acetyltransferase n=1 Tax=Cupriavidus sp. AU9028 TaxID=2871157 RepID=UPI001C97B5E2|nr:ribosomal protein S18-alanine N-acetyltransferase [Cupriavidus sp. AU9028]MBY4898022.1 ribosomal protein S18-alanine N-acetyltransferase [Cupriavidus sp. AU9028]
MSTALDGSQGQAPANGAAAAPAGERPALPPGGRLERMSARDLDEVVQIEQRAYTHPWSRGNFENSLKAGHIGLTLRDAAGLLNSYAILMPVVDEMHLLNLTVAPQLQRKGLGRLMLGLALAVSREHRLPDMLLEVRPSNTAALALYHAAGFVEIGRRRGYYPADDGGREDALVLRRDAGTHAALAGETA